MLIKKIKLVIEEIEATPKEEEKEDVPSGSKAGNSVVNNINGNIGEVVTNVGEGKMTINKGLSGEEIA